jgi:hypothetical protein
LSEQSLLQKNNDPFTDIDTWKFIVDQDYIPDWFVKDYEETRMRDAVKEWAKNRIYIGVDDLVLSEGAGYYLKDCNNVTLRGTAKVNELWGTSSVLLSGVPWFGSDIKAETIILCDNAIIRDDRVNKIFTSGNWELVVVERKDKV